MTINFIQLLLSFFLLFAISRVFLRFWGGTLSLFGFFFWSILFGLALILVLFPVLTSEVAKFIGIGRGVDAVLYASVVLLYYLVFRLYIFLEDIRHEISDLVKEISLQEIKKTNDTKKSKN